MFTTNGVSFPSAKYRELVLNFFNFINRKKQNKLFFYLLVGIVLQRGIWEGNCFFIYFIYPSIYDRHSIRSTNKQFCRPFNIGFYLLLPCYSRSNSKRKQTASVIKSVTPAISLLIPDVI